LSKFSAEVIAVCINGESAHLQKLLVYTTAARHLELHNHFCFITNWPIFAGTNMAIGQAQKL